MKSLVVYDSEFGNTELVAQAITRELLESGPCEAVKVDKVLPAMLTGVDLLIIGSPTQAFHATKTMQNFLNNLTPDMLSKLAVAVFDTRFHTPVWLFKSAALKMEKMLKQRGYSLIMPAESFFVTGKYGPLEDGELERAAAWTYQVARRCHSHKAVAV